MINSLLTQLQNLKTKLDTNEITTAEASHQLQEIISQYHNIKNQEIDTWANNFFDFFSLPEAQKQLKQLFNTYLGTTDANNRDDRNKSLFLTNQIEELLLILNKANC